jgi:hypothetical protein
MTNNSRLANNAQDRSNIFESRKFTYKELKLMTADFKEEIGRGGFGGVFLGYLENGSPVAVKMRSKTSSQGDKEFLTEVGLAFYLQCAIENFFPRTGKRACHHYIMMKRNGTTNETCI